jgi:nonribosomal peptide synthetase protein BlmIV
MIAAAPDARWPVPVGSLFERRAALSPDRVALLFGEHTLTYRQLNGRANRLARLLRRRGVGPEVVVGVCLPRSFDLVVALLAVVKAGGAYLALDVDHPTPRSTWMLQEAAATLLLTNTGMEWHDTNTPCAVLSLDESREALANEDPDDLPSAADVDSLFKIVFTSGSTGRPKGVLVPMRAVLHRFAAMAACFPFVPGDVALLHRSCMIVGSSWDALGPLIAGVPTLILARFDPTDAHVWRSVVNSRVSHLAASPSLWNLLVSVAERSAPSWDSLRMAITGGELTDTKLATRWQRVFPRATLVNVYGLTECIYPAACDASRAIAGEQYVPAGTPFPKVSIHVLDAEGARRPAGAPGDIHIGGPCLARGYLHAPKLTAETFLPDPFIDVPGQRMFRTGDWGTWRADGVLMAGGRRDGQIKIRGVRVGLGEVEAALVACERVRQAAVLARADERGTPQLTAYVVPESGAELSARALRTAVRQRLPLEAVPTRFVLLPELPTTLHGKVDRSRLRALEPAGSSPSRAAPRTPTERAVAAIWKEVLQIPEVDVHDDFFALGGASLAAMQIASRIRAVFDIPFSHGAVLDADSLEDVAVLVDAAQIDRHRTGQGTTPFFTPTADGVAAVAGLQSSHAPPENDIPSAARPDLGIDVPSSSRS